MWTIFFFCFKVNVNNTQYMCLWSVTFRLKCLQTCFLSSAFISFSHFRQLWRKEMTVLKRWNLAGTDQSRERQLFSLRENNSCNWIWLRAPSRERKTFFRYTCVQTCPGYFILLRRTRKYSKQNNGINNIRDFPLKGFTNPPNRLHFQVTRP